MMLKLLYLFLLITPLASHDPMVADPVDHVAELLKSGNTAELSKIFASTVDVTILSQNDMYAPAQATAALDKFFKANPPRAVKVLHRVGSNPNIKFAVLQLTAGNATYRTTISLKSTNGQFLLNEIRIEPEKS